MRVANLIGLLIVLGCGCARKAEPFSQHPVWRNNPESSPRPYASRHATEIALHPSGASFRIPEEWLDWHSRFRNNIHLTAQDLEAVARGAGDWDTEYASLCNAIFPFDCCAAHVGGEGWGDQGVSFGDLQVRVYDMSEPPEGLERRFNTEGLGELRRIAPKSGVFRREMTGEWQRTLFVFDRFYYDYGATAHVDVRLHRFDERTIVFVFMYTDHERHEGTIRTILESFRWPSKRDGTNVSKTGS
jgi:hypothetical protein